MKNKLLFFLFLFVQATFSRASTVKLMYWNLLNYPEQSNISGDTALRHPFYRSVIQYEDPDILVTGENTTPTPTNMFLNNVMNELGTVYSKGTFINGYDTNNEIFYKTSLFTFLANTRIRTDVRDINEFKLVHILSGDTIRIYAVHLKASSGSSNEVERAREVDSLRNVTNHLPSGSNFVVCGDFNIYGDFESAYQNLLQDNSTDDGNFVDPINMTGTWHNYNYRFYHTQSTRTASFGGGATGGLNDRFDMILFSNAIDQGSSGIAYVPGSTTPVGNDGNHYSQAINVIPNTFGPSTVINALYNASDHLPVYAMFDFSNVSGISSPASPAQELAVLPNPVNDHAVLKFRIDKPVRVIIKIFDVLGKEVFELMDESKPPGKFELPLILPDCLENGLYFIHLQTENGFSSTKFVKS